MKEKIQLPPQILLIILFCGGLFVSPGFSNPAPEKDDREHLLLRAGFGLPSGKTDFNASTRNGLVGELLKSARTKALIEIPQRLLSPVAEPGTIQGMSREEKKDLRMERRKRGEELKAWWLREMVLTDSPITERMTLFWHNHFTSSLKKVKFPALMARQNQVLRKYALGSFSQMLLEIAHDPAMILYLDGQRNQKRKPNENFARELLELFTLGEGHYTEKDIKEAARAFSGHKVDRRSGEFHFAPRRHDHGLKVFLSQRGRWIGEDIISILLDHPQTSLHITAKLWKEFVSLPLPEALLGELAGGFRDSGYSISSLLEKILNSEQFWSEENRGNSIKSPVELVVSTLRGIEFETADYSRLVKLCRRLGQDLLDPPSVKGWMGGKTWINTYTLLLRQQALRRLVKRFPEHRMTASFMEPEWQLK